MSTGSIDLGNEDSGVEIDNATNTVVGGTGNEGNVISGNNARQMRLNQAEGTLVQGNRIGLSANGIGVLVNSDVPAGQRPDGIWLFQSHGNTFGGLVNHSQNAIAVLGTAVVVNGNNNRFFRTFIGWNFFGGTQPPVDIGLGGFAVSGSGNQIGSGFEKDSNIVTTQESHGIRVSGNDSLNNRILVNSIFDNGGLGIDLVSGFTPVNPNDDRDEDVGPNGLQNFPVLEAVDDASILGRLQSKPNTGYRLEFYSSEECDESGHGEGQTLLEVLEPVGTDAQGRADFNTSFGVESGFVTATATESSTEALGGTSEFSACTAPSTPVTFVVNSSQDSGEPLGKAGDGKCWTGARNDSGDDECTLRAAIEEANALEGHNRIHFDIPGNQVHTLEPVSLLGQEPGFPPIRDKVWINGYTQPGATRATEIRSATLKIEISGNEAGFEASGLTFVKGSAGSRVSGLVVNQFHRNGILLQDGGCIVEGNYIATDPTGTDVDISPLNNHGVWIEGSAGNSIGGEGVGFRNIIFGDTDAVKVTGPGAQFNQILDNYMGFGADDTPHGTLMSVGIRIEEGANNNTVGTLAHGNTIASSTFQAIALSDSDDNQIVGNQVGCDCPKSEFGENRRAIAIFDSARTIISQNTIQNTEDRGGAPEPHGILVSGSESEGTEILGNRILGNAGNGILLRSGASQTRVWGNVILENEGHGILVDSGASETLIGDLDPDKGNLIVDNGRHGDDLVNAEVRISRSRRNTILSNQIAAPGIVLRDPNDIDRRQLDALDRDEGPNDLLNHPTIRTATTGNGSSRVVLLLTTPASDQNTVQIFDNASCGRPVTAGGEMLIATETGVSTFGFGGGSLTVDLGALHAGSLSHRHGDRRRRQYLGVLGLPGD